MGLTVYDNNDIPLGLLAGILYSIGTLLMNQAIRAGGPTSVVILVTSLYPFVILFLDIVEGSPLTWNQIVGSSVALVALVLITKPSDTAEVAESSHPQDRWGIWWKLLCFISTILYALWVYCLAKAAPYLAGPVAVWQSAGVFQIARQDS